MRTLILVLIVSAVTLWSSARAAAVESQRGPFRAALERVERGAALDPQMRQSFAAHPLLPWLEYAELRHRLERADQASVARMLATYPDLAFAEPLRRAWLRQLARRRDWPGVLHHFREEADGNDIVLTCHWLTARLSSGEDSAALNAAIADVWRHGDSRPDACDPAFDALRSRGALTAELRWQRIERAADAGNPTLMRFLARGLGADDKALAEGYAGFIDSPDRRALAWPRNERSRQIATLGLTRLARQDPAAGERLLVELAPLQIGAVGEGAVRYQVALWSAASYLPNAAQRLAAVPQAAYDERLHEWRVREALARSAWAEALVAIERMGDAQRAEARWRYLEARMRDLLGEPSAAAALFARLAEEPNYHGFLAADRLGRPYALCPLEVAADGPLRERVKRDPALLRAIELRAIDRLGWADLEWRALLGRLDDEGRRHAVAEALAARWYDRAVFSLARPEDQRYYTLRFPFAHRSTLRREARRHGLDEAWVTALIRAESAWQPHARSSADARGLMQLLPATGAATARQLGLPWSGPDALYQPQTNIALGTGYLASMLARHGGQPYLATAAYNAGPAPIGRWLAQRPAHDIDLWVETIPFRETREYVGRIMAFSVVYDWRLSGKAVPLGARMRGETVSERRSFACPTPSPGPASPS